MDFYTCLTYTRNTEILPVGLLEKTRAVNLRNRDRCLSSA
jgi:hypothetical protein